MICGGSGLVGRYLSAALLKQGYSVSWLSRNRGKMPDIDIYKWDPEEGIADPFPAGSADILINLAGENIGRSRWTGSRKKEIIESRVNSTKFLFRLMNERNERPSLYISASGINIYGTLTTEQIFREEDSPANDFLGMVCRRWEEAVSMFSDSGIRSVILRSAVVLEKSDSALSRILMTAKAGFLAMAGSGRQYMPWIHINDLCRIYIYAIEDTSMYGVYNAVSPTHVTHRQFMRSLSRVTETLLLPVGVPGIMLRIIYGEMSGIVLKGSRVSCEKISTTGFRFNFPGIEEALRDVLTWLK